MCKTQNASSVFLSILPADDQLTLSWEEHVSWKNIRYVIYRLNNNSNTWDSLTQTTEHSYVDDSLTNGSSYCYYFKSIGEYSDSTLPNPLINLSQRVCTEPKDLTPPCQPEFYVGSDCSIPENTIVWNNPNNYCTDDVVKYNVYFSPTTEAALSIIYTTADMNDTILNHHLTNPVSIAGCYIVTAIDSFGNESPMLSKICTDNCPEYTLPNIFTPNGDGKNDFFIPLPYAFIKDIDIKIYDRWGLLMFQSNDPDIRWDGKNQNNKLACTDGVYYYTCTVNEIRIAGIVARKINGFIQLVNDKSSIPK